MSEDLDFIGKGEVEKWRNNDTLKLKRTWGTRVINGASEKLQLLGHNQETKEMEKLSVKDWDGWEGIKYHYSSF